MQLNEKGIPTVQFADDYEYRIWGSPLYNENVTKTSFNEHFADLIASTN